MSERFFAQVALGEGKIPVGRLDFTRDGPRQHSAFTYDPSWLVSAQRFGLQPDLPLDAAAHFASGGSVGDVRVALHGAFSVAAPDSWGRRLLERAYGAGLSEFEYLVLSDDFSRQGALRFLDVDGQVIAGHQDAVPRLLDLEEITRLSRAYEQGLELSEQDLRALAGAGGSLGGARPKANVRDGDTLWLAKFTSVHDRQPIERVEISTLKLAEACGIRAPEARLALQNTPYPVALLRRFDRRGTARIPYISARTALGKTGNALGSYTEIADFIRAWSSDPVSDLRELYLRLVFTILVSNKDDHLKNHGFLYVGRDRWRLSPVFDVNPAPDRNPHLETAILEDGSNERSILLALEASEFFELPNAEAKALIRDMGDKIAALWRETFRQHGLTGTQARDYEPAFVNDEAEIARSLDRHI